MKVQGHIYFCDVVMHIVYQLYILLRSPFTLVIGQSNLLPWCRLRASMNAHMNISSLWSSNEMK